VFGLGAATRMSLAPGATDMRKGFNGLYGLVRDQRLCDPLSGHLFLFSNSQRKRPVLLSITHKLGSEDEAELDICEACETSAHDGVSRRRVFCACTISE
jgi:hypothetical protein